MNFFRSRVLLGENLHWQPSEIDRLPYYELEYTIEIYEDILKQRKEEQEKQGGDYQSMYGDPSKVGNDMLNKAKQGFKMPTMPNIPMPKL